VIKLKDPRSLPYTPYQVCEVDPCLEESVRVWASSETRIIDICKKHYEQVILERYKS
jgi:hypothetical protein